MNAPLFFSARPRIDLDAGRDEIAAAAVLLDDPTDPEQLPYLIYTSGSPGRRCPVTTAAAADTPRWVTGTPAAAGAAIDDVFTSTEMTNEAGDSDYGYYWTSTSANFTSGEPYYYAWYVAFGRAVNGEGLDFHGAGAVRFDTKTEDGPDGEGGERYTNFVRLVRHLG